MIDFIIARLAASGLTVETVEGIGYNVTSNATGAVLERLISEGELKRLAVCMQYVADRHGRDITERFTYQRPAHSF